MTRWNAKDGLTPDFTPNLKARDKARRTERAAMARAASAAATQRNDRLPVLAILNRPLCDLKTPARALRKLDPPHVREVAASINQLGFCVPVLVGDGGEVIDGAVRVEAARLIGLESAPCIPIGHLSRNEQRVLRLAVNRMGEKGSWDLEELKIEFEELRLSELPIEVSGFALDEIDQILTLGSDENIEAGPLEPAEGAAAITRLGDMFDLGPHRLICGDSTCVEVLHRLMTEKDGSKRTARLVLTDEPYNLKIAGNVTRRSHREFPMASGEMNTDEFHAFNMQWIGGTLAYLVDGGVFGTFIDWRGQHVVHDVATKLGLKPLSCIAWVKTNAGMGSLYRSQFELLPLFKKGRAAHVNNIELGRRGRWRSNVWSYPGASSLGSDARRGLKDHPTVKPVALLEDALLDLTERGDIVLDPFLGSGSLLIAAEKAGRICRAIELDPLYVDSTIRRYQAVTGRAVHVAESSETFADLTARRSAPRGNDNVPSATVA